MNLQNLLDAGFQRVGTWRLIESGSGMRLEGDAAREAGVYAYTVDGVVCYVGSAQRGLHTLRRYATTKTMKTSTRIRGEIISCLNDGKTVEVYALQPPATHWKGLPVDLVAGLEEGLIRSIQPVWNKRSNRKDRAPISLLRIEGLTDPATP
jgi:hypothetical protein